MRVSLYLSFSPPAPEAEMTVDEFITDGSLFLNELNILDKIVSQRKLPRLSTFMDTREPPDDFDGDPGDFDRMMGPCDQWYAIEDALTTMNTPDHNGYYCRAYPDRPGDLETVRRPGQHSIGTGKNCFVLRIAQKSEVSFRFDVG